MGFWIARDEWRRAFAGEETKIGTNQDGDLGQRE